MSIVYALKSESKYCGNFFQGDSAPNLTIVYMDNVMMPKIAIHDFETWFGPNTGHIGMLRDFDEYLKDSFITPKK